MTEPAGSQRPQADTSVRIAWADDATAIAAIQVRSWRDSYADLIPAEDLDALPAGCLRRALAGGDRPAARRPAHACWSHSSEQSVRGFAATAPATDADASPATDAEITEFSVDPEHRHTGHGSRLLHAVVDTLRSDKFRPRHDLGDVDRRPDAGVPDRSRVGRRRSASFARPARGRQRDRQGRPAPHRPDDLTASSVSSVRSSVACRDPRCRRAHRVLRGRPPARPGRASARRR